MTDATKQLVFIDDSGDPGFKLNRGSSKHFVIACVIFDDPLDAEETALQMKKFRRDLGWRQDKEVLCQRTPHRGLLEYVYRQSNLRRQVAGL